MRQFAFFCIGGSLAFLIDGGLTQLWVSCAKIDALISRALSFPPAILFTWWFNRRLTFKVRKSASPLRQLPVYMGTQAFGLLLNLATYMFLVSSFELATTWPIIAVAAGTVVGLSVNFLGAKHVVFR